MIKWLKHFFKNASLRTRLMLLLSGITLIIAIITTITGLITLRKEINTVFDTQQVFFAERLASSNITQGFRKSLPPRGNFIAKVDDDALAFAIFTRNGEQILNDGRKGRYIPFMPARGFQSTLVEEYDDGKRDVEKWRIYWLKQRDFYIAVGQEVEYRQDLINKLAFSQMSSWLPAFPIVILGIFWIIRRELASLKRLEQQVNNRKPDEVKLIDEIGLPKEVMPLVKGLNHYFTRTSLMLSRERHFTSNAAHELRSPLAGLRVQTELAQMTMDEPELHKEALNNMIVGIDRISQLIEQLLVLSRLENIEQLDDLEHISWTSLLEQSVSEIYSQAEQKQSEIQLDILSEPKAQKGKPILLTLILRNLLNNAINYTPKGSLIKLTLSNQKVMIEDNGNGVSESDLLKLGQPFFRPTERPAAMQDEKGSGLGLSITKRIAELHGFDFKISRSEMGGLKMEIIFSQAI